MRDWSGLVMRAESIQAFFRWVALCGGEVDQYRPPVVVNDNPMPPVGLPPPPFEKPLEIPPAAPAAAPT